MAKWDKSPVEDLLTKEMDELIKQFTTEEVLAQHIVKLKAQLKGYFSNDIDSIKTGFTLTVDRHKLYIYKVNHSTGRVTFKFKDDPKKFSVAIAHLTGKEEVFHFKVGDWVVFLNDICEVKNIYPSSRDLAIDYQGTKRVVNVSKVTKYYHEDK